MLKTRIATAIVLAIIVLSVLFVAPPLAGVAVIALLMTLGAWEWARFAGWNDTGGRIGFTLVLAILGLLAWRLTPTWRELHALMLIAAIWWGIAFLWLALAPGRITRVTSTVAGVLVLVPAGVGLGRLLLIEAPERGAFYLFYLLLVIWAADIGAYFAGRAFGRLKLAPAVSPNKTWEGLLGGVAGSLAIAAGGAAWFGVGAIPFVGLGLAIALVSVVGDLTESMFKRHAGLKDSGTLLPGHGGVLDRIDSITAGIPFFLLGLGWLGILK